MNTKRTLRPAHELTAQRKAGEAARDAHDHEASLARAVEAIEVAHAAGRRQVTTLTFPPSVVEALTEAGYRVTLDRACGMGDVDAHTIRWD